MTIEGWKPVPGFDGVEASTLGRVRRVSGIKYALAEPRILAGFVGKHGYRTYSLSMGDRNVVVLGHRLVCMAFHGLPPTPKHQCAHGDANRTNNRPDNLRWATHAENSLDRDRHGNTLSGGRHPLAKVTSFDVAIIRSLYAQGAEQRDIGREFNLNQAQVWRICWNRSWSSIRPTALQLEKLIRRNPAAWSGVKPMSSEDAQKFIGELLVVSSHRNQARAAADAVNRMGGVE